MDRHRPKGCWIQILALLSPRVSQLFFTRGEAAVAQYTDKASLINNGKFGDHGRSKPNIAAAWVL